MNIRIILFLIAFLTSTCIFAQGEIFSRDEANKLFGQVLERIPMTKATLKLVIAKSPQKVLFAISQGKVLFATEKRVALLSAETAATYRVVSSNILSEFLSKSTEETVYFERRESVYSLTSGDYTLERTTDCPPYCGE